MATLRELEEYYSFEDVMTMIEIIQINSANEEEAYKRIQSKG